MAMKRKRVYGRRVRGRKTKKVRRYAARVGRRFRSRGVGISVKRTWWTQNWSLSTALTSGFWRYFGISLSAVPNVAEYTNLFDRYKINAIKFTFVPRYDSFAGNDTVDTVAPGITNANGNNVSYIIDRTTTVAPSGVYTTTNWNTFAENGTPIMRKGNSPFSIFIKKPAVKMAADSSNGAMYSYSPWLSTQQAAIGHQGTHVFFSDVNFTGLSAQSFDIFTTVYMQFRGMK